MSILGDAGAILRSPSSSWLTRHLILAHCKHMKLKYFVPSLLSILRSGNEEGLSLARGINLFSPVYLIRMLADNRSVSKSIQTQRQIICLANFKATEMRITSSDDAAKLIKICKNEKKNGTKLVVNFFFLFLFLSYFHLP